MARTISAAFLAAEPPMMVPRDATVGPESGTRLELVFRNRIPFMEMPRTSATICDICVWAPCPMSVIPEETITLPSVCTETMAPAASAPSAPSETPR